MENNISYRELMKFNNSFCFEHSMQRKDIEKAKRIFKKEYEYNLALFKKGKLKINFTNNKRKYK